MTVPEHYSWLGAIAFDAEVRAGAVWLAYVDGKLRMKDSCLFGDMPVDRIAEAVKARGQHPIAWEAGNKQVADKLLYAGCSMVPEADAVREDDAMAAMGSRELADRLQQGVFVVGEREGAWRKEYETWRRSREVVAQTPLLRATRLALARLDYLPDKTPGTGAAKNYPQINVV